jgi:hypothetical protein
MRKRTASGLMFLLLSVSILALTSDIPRGQAQDNRIFFEPSTPTVEVAQIFTMTVMVEVTNLASIAVSISWDPNLLYCTDVDVDFFCGSGIPFGGVLNNSAGTARGFGWLSYVNNTGIGSVIIAEFLTLQEGGSPVEFIIGTMDTQMRDLQGDPMVFTVENGYVIISSLHDVAVTDVAPSKTVVGRNYSISINVTVENQGNYTETFDITTYYRETVPNGDFEKDPTGTSYNDISHWNHSSYDQYDGIAGENMEIDDYYYFSGNKSLYSYVKSGGKKENMVYQYLWTENPVSTTSDYISLWIGGDDYTTSTRYWWRIELYLTDGTDTHYEILRCDCWGINEGCNPNHYDYYNATATGADGMTWKRYTRRIPDNLDKSNLTIKIRHPQRSWDYTTASSWYRLDNIYFSDSEGNPTIIGTETITNLSLGEETTITFAWNTTGMVKGNYTITAHAHPVPGEAHTADNNCTDGIICVTIAGDLDCDGFVFLTDLDIFGRSWYKALGDPDYNPNCDFDGNGQVFLSNLDIFGRNWYSS